MPYSCINNSCFIQDIYSNVKVRQNRVDLEAIVYTFRYKMISYII